MFIFADSIKIKNQNTIAFLLIVLAMVGCDFEVKKDYLGNNIYLSEYDNVDRRIFYQSKKNTDLVIEIVPMTVMEISHNNEWIIAKSGDKKRLINFKYWVLRNRYSTLPNSESVKNNTNAFDNQEDFKRFLLKNNIDLELEKID